MVSIIVGTNRVPSRSQEVAQFYAQKLVQRQVTHQIISLSELPKDFVFSALYQNNGKSEEFNAITKKVADSKSLVFVVPEYNSSFPGVLKAFIDGMAYPSPLANKKIALVGISSGIQASILSMSHLSDILNYLGADVLALRLKIPNIEKNFQDNAFTQALHEQLMEQQIDKLLA